jgi:enoyl-CoA hydratase
MQRNTGETLSWELQGTVAEVTLHRKPCNEIGLCTLEELEVLVSALREGGETVRALILTSEIPAGFCAGADLRELYGRAYALPEKERAASIRNFIERIHAVFNWLDAAPFVTIAVVHGVTFGGGFELALTADILIAERSTRFCFPELRLGLIPGFGGIPRLKRDAGNGVVRDLLLTGRSINATRAHSAGFVSQLVGEGRGQTAARAMAAQAAKFDAHAAQVAKQSIKPLPSAELQQEIDIFCELFSRPAVKAALKAFVENSNALPYLP